FAHLLDKPALFTILRGQRPMRYVHGLISAFSQGDTGNCRTRYQAVIEPKLARAGLRSNWRIFQQQSVPQILETLFKAQRITDFELGHSFPHAPREFCVQAGETDLAFITRLAAEEGFIYRFVHSAKGHRLL
ncbi:type VI secretion system tip protein VgrG, partial [Pseudomonas sp. BW16M2]